MVEQLLDEGGNLGANGIVAGGLRIAGGLGMSIRMQRLPRVCMDFFGARAVSSIIGTLYTGAAFGNLAGPVVAGWMFDRSGNYLPVAAGCLVLGMLSSGCAWRATRREP